MPLQQACLDSEARAFLSPLPQRGKELSKHLRTLAHGGLVGCRREGAFAYYRVTDPSVPGLGLLACGRLCQNDESGPN